MYYSYTISRPANSIFWALRSFLILRSSANAHDRVPARDQTILPPPRERTYLEPLPLLCWEARRARNFTKPFL